MPDHEDVSASVPEGVPREVPVFFRDGGRGFGAGSGGQAAWTCRCGSDVALIGYTDRPDVTSPTGVTVCRRCARRYRVRGRKRRASPRYVEELPS